MVKDYTKGYTITVLGCGVMGSAVTSAILSSKFDVYPTKIICCNNSKQSSANVQAKINNPIVEYSYGISSNSTAVKEADVVILGCKPYMYQEIYQQVKGSLSGEQLFISLLAGTTLDELSIFSHYVAKVMTNTPAQFGCGMATVAFSDKVNETQEQLVMTLIGSVGKAVKIPEKNMDAATALVGSAPAFCLVMMESMIEGGVRMGMPYDVAKQCAAKVMEGTGKMVDVSNEHPAVLKSKVCTPGGTTIGGLLKLEDAGIRGSISRAIEESTNISKSFAKK